MAKKLIMVFKPNELKNPKFRKELRAAIKKLKEASQFEEDRKYYGIPEVKR
jgi:hypothetical protein